MWVCVCVSIVSNAKTVITVVKPHLYKAAKNANELTGQQGHWVFKGPGNNGKVNQDDEE